MASGTRLSRRSFLSAAGAGVAGAGSLSELGVAYAQTRPALTVAIGGDVQTLDPHKVFSVIDYYLLANVFEGLYSHDENGNPVPGLAESVTVAPDGLSYDFVLRAGAKFHNGDPVTSEDIVFSWQRAAAPATRNPRANVLVANIAAVEPLDPRRVRLKLKSLDPSLLENVDAFWYIVPKKHMTSVGDEAFVRNPVGTGPFRFVRRQPNQSITIEGFSEHWGRQPQVGTVRLEIIPDDQARMAKIQTGEADIVTNLPAILAPEIEGSHDVKLVRGGGYNNVYVAINNRSKNPALAKKEVRQALNMAVDRPTLADAIVKGYARLWDLFCSPGIIGCDVKVEPYKYDPAAARRMLERAGFDFARPLNFVGLASGRLPQGTELVEGIAYFLDKVGVKTNINMLEYGAWAAVVGAREKDPNVDLVVTTLSDYNNDPSGRLLRSVYSNTTFSWYSNPEVDALLDGMNQFQSPTDREGYIRKLFAKLHDEAPAINLWSTDALYATRKNIAWKPTPATWPILWNVRKS
jgi:peptide/nickel transport system substrate-binding protein